jgi:UDP-N-acetylmuramoyl-tripeptide--D-alanyl-D-alanine ligase
LDVKALSIHEIRRAVNGRALTALPADLPPIGSVCIDTRRLEPGCLFVAISGEKFNAHAFLPDAAAKGAVAAIVEEVPARLQPNVHLIHVPSTRTALGRLATHVRRQMKAKVIAVGGSNGKTTTKYFLDAVLRGTLTGTISPKSFNNDIGVPLAIFPADPLQDYLVLEIGTNHHGEVKLLSEMAQPDIAVITNVGAEHLEGLDDLDGVRREEASITTGLNPRGCLIVNGDDAKLLSLVSQYKGQRITFGFEPHNDLFATDVQCTDQGVEFCLNGSRRRVFVPMLGRHSAANALAAIAVARKMGLAEESIIQSLSQAQGPDMRLQLNSVRGGVRVLNDAYNANPNSTRAAIETLCALPARGRRVAVLGDMLELGKHREAYHREIGAFAATCRLDLLVCVGKSAALIARGAAGAGMKGAHIVKFADATAAAKSFPRRIRKDDLVLLKASRGIGLEAVARSIREAHTTALARKSAS